MVSFTILAGGYDVFVATYLFNANTSSLALVGKSPTGTNPSWLSSLPSNRSVLYATNEIAQGALQSFTVSPSGTLSPAVSTVSSGGDSPAFAVALSQGQVAIVNYNGANGRVIPTTSSPLTFDDSAGIITFPPPAGGVSHPHHAVEYRNEIFVPDLGADTVWRLRRNVLAGNWSIAGSITQPLGSGPRHIAIRDDRLFTLHELSSTLSIQPIPKITSTYAPVIANVSIVPAVTPPGAKYSAAEILFPSPTLRFPKSYIYVTNRNIGVPDTTQGDSIAIFEHVNIGRANEGLKLIKQVFTGLSQVRGIAIGHVDNGSEEFLVAAGVAGTGGVKVFKRVDGGRDLVEVASNKEVLTRTSFVWL